jgi:hypothetical protein
MQRMARKLLGLMEDLLSKYDLLVLTRQSPEGATE